MKYVSHLLGGICIAIILLFLSVTLHAQTHPNANYNPTDAHKVYGLSRLCSEIKYNFAYYDQLTFDWDSLCMSSIPAILATKDRWEYTREMQRICARLGDGHTFVNHIFNPEPGDYPKIAPLTTRFLENRIWVEGVYRPYLQDLGIGYGTEIIRINGMPALEYGDKHIRPYISSSTPQWTLVQTYEHELTGGRDGEEMILECINAQGKHITARFVRGIDWNLHPRRPHMELSILPDNIGLLRIDGFMDSQMNARFDSIYTHILTTDALIIDLRKNKGGISNYADYILRHLTDRPIHTGDWDSPMHIPAHVAWNQAPQRFMQRGHTMQPVQKEHYTRPVIVLISATTYSSGEEFCTVFQGMKRGQIIGTPSAGSSGNILTMHLLWGVTGLTICSKNNMAADGGVFIGKGIQPDIEIRETVSDFLQGKDPVLDKALQVIAQQ